ncbi:MAG: protein kinase [Steroidobacteraceae bacterium]
MNTEAVATTVDLRFGARRGNAGDPGAHGAFAPGRMLRERYVIVERLGTGGTGTVFKALDRYRASLPDAEQHVALKVLHVGSESPDQSMKDLARELHSGRALCHRNIVRLYELDRDEEVVFFTMELLDGELLRDLIDRMRPNVIPPSQAWQIIRQLGDGLQHAHERGIVHGDLKPSNLFLTRSGELRILDFGAAQTVVKPPTTPGVSKAPATYGTPAYASCEQLEGRGADPCDDLYAFAVICFQLLAGVHPFAGRPATQARNYGVKANRPRGLTGDQWRVLQAGLSWHRSGRSMPVHAWVQRLTRDVAAGVSSTSLHDLAAAGTTRPRSRGVPVAAFVAVLVIAAIGMGEMWHRSAQAPSGASGAVASAVNVDAREWAPAEGPPAVRAVNDGVRSAGAKEEPAAAVQARPWSAPSPSKIVVNGYQVSVSDRFVEVRVHRNQLLTDSSFVWWTEPATARQNVDYIHQAKAIQSFPSGRRSTRLYVKLLPEAARSQRDYFYIAIAQPGLNRAADKVTRAQIWLPTPRAGLQASR